MPDKSVASNLKRAHHGRQRVGQPLQLGPKAPGDGVWTTSADLPRFAQFAHRAWVTEVSERLPVRPRDQLVTEFGGVEPINLNIPTRLRAPGGEGSRAGVRSQEHARYIGYMPT